MTEPVKPRQVKCPHCGLLALYSTENPFRPFCSERCRIMDLGAWADESYRVPVAPSSSDSLSYDEEPEDGGDDHSGSEDKH